MSIQDLVDWTRQPWPLEEALEEVLVEVPRPGCDLSLGQMGLIGASVGLATALYNWDTLSAWMSSRPYGRQTVSLAGAPNRALLDWTRVDERVDLYPLSHVAKVKPRTTDNGHAMAGAVRDEARATVEALASTCGRSLYEISPGGHSVDKNGGVVKHIAPADLWTATRDPKVSGGSLVAAIDTDYYVEDWDEYLACGVPALIYTFAPEKVAGVDGDCRYRIKNDRVVYEVSGGTAWEHEVWDWTVFGEFLIVHTPRRQLSWRHWFLSFLGIRHTRWVKVCHARPWKETPQRALVWTLPQFSGLMVSWLKSTIVGSRRLKRQKFQMTDRPDWNAIVSLDDKAQPRMSIGRAGDDAEVTLPKVDYDTLMGLSSAQSVTTRMLGMGHTDTRSLALVGQHFQQAPRQIAEVLRLARGAAVPTCHRPLCSYADAPEPSFRCIARSLVENPSLVPEIKRWEAQSASIDIRVTDVQNYTVPCERIRGYAREFAMLLVPVPHQVAPFSVAETVELMDKPSQVLAVRRVWETIDAEPRALIESFIKNEPCMKSPRLISAWHDTRYLVALSAFTLKAAEELKTGPLARNYIPGHTPVEIADRVCEYVGEVEEVLETDFSNLDGTVSPFLQESVVGAVLLRMFHTSTHDKLKALLRNLVSCPARAKRFGFRYEAGPGVKSGSPTTTLGNTLICLFTMYAAIRRAEDETIPIGQALLSLGLAYGDDALFERRYKLTMEWVCAQLGLRIKCARYEPEKGVTFLARVYPAPLTTTTTFQDPLRTLRKLHLTGRNPNVPLADAAIDRVEGYLATDSLTPVIATFCNVVKAHYRDSQHATSETIRAQRGDRNKDRPYWCVKDEKSWPQAKQDVELMRQCMAARMGTTPEVLKDYEQVLGSVQDPMEFPAICLVDDEPYKDTLGEDGLPVLEPVAERKVNSQRNNAVSRVSLQNGRCPQGTSRGSAQSGATRTDSLTGGGLGDSDSDGGISRNQGSKRSGQHPREAQLAGNAEDACPHVRRASPKAVRSTDRRRATGGNGGREGKRPVPAPRTRPARPARGSDGNTEVAAK